MSLIGDGAWGPKKVSVFKDFFYSFLSHVTINSKERGQIKLGDHIYRSQQIALDAIFTGLENDIHDNKIGKARQLGISSIIRPLKVAWLGAFPGMQGVLVYDTDPHKEEAREELVNIIENLPSNVKFPRIKRANRNIIILDNNSNMRLLSAGVSKRSSGSNLGKSSGINLGHMSEMCSWQNPDGVVALKASLAEIYTNRLFTWESTAHGFNVWYDMCKEAQADTLNQQFTFIGWWGKEDYILRKGTRLFDHYIAAPISVDEAKRIATVKEKYGWDITDEQLAWWRRKVDPAGEQEADEREDGLVTENYPWDEEEMWQSTGSTFFKPERLTEMHREAAKEKYTGYHFWPGHDFFNCQIAKAKSYRDVDIKVFDEPHSDSIYVVAGDPAHGYDPKNDRAACQVIKCYADKIEQVAEAASPLWAPETFAHVMLSMVGYYGMDGQNEIQFMLELQGGGEATWLAIKHARQLITNPYLKDISREAGVENLFINFKNFIYRRSDSMGEGQVYQWKTTPASKVPLMERLRDVIQNETLLIRSTDTLNEMKAISRDGDKIGADGSKKDDRTVCLALAVRAWEDRVRPRMLLGRRTKEAWEAARQADPRSRYQLFTAYQMDQMRVRRQSETRIVQNHMARDRWRYR